MSVDPILYIDDEPGNLTGFKYTFRRKFDITTASCAIEALELVKSQRFKVIISDQRMPKMTGLDFFFELNKIQPDTIKIILTAFKDNETIIRAINETGIYRFLTKPWDKDDMQITIKSAIDKYNLKDENNLLIHDLKKVNSELKQSHKLLEESEEKFRNIFNQSRDGIVISDDNGKIVDVNPIVLDFLGYTREETLKIKSDDLILEKYKKVFEERQKLLWRQQTIKATEIAIKGRNDKIIPVEIQSQLLNFRNRVMILSIIRDITERKETERNILKTIIETEEKERSNFSSELHDGMGPLLSTMKLYLGSLKKEATPAKEKNRIISEIQNILEEAIVTTKEISNNLTPSILQDFGLVVALEAFIERIKSGSKTIIQLNTDIYNNKQDKNIELNLYRIITELINNTLKHAKATRIEIYLSSDNQITSLNYMDNGIGFDLYKSYAPGNAKHGLKNIASRVSSINGTLEIKTSENSGFKIVVQIPHNTSSNG